MPGPVFFIDRSMGANIVPHALREAGFEIVTMRERYGEIAGQGLPDPAWIRDASELGELIICKDKNIAKRPIEVQTIQRHAARAIAMGNGAMTGEAMAKRLIEHREAILDRSNQSGPFVYSLNETSLVRLRLGE
jgi:hypothetical protein